VGSVYVWSRDYILALYSKPEVEGGSDWFLHDILDFMVRLIRGV